MFHLKLFFEELGLFDADCNQWTTQMTLLLLH
jgi:hypothetical protein